MQSLPFSDHKHFDFTRPLDFSVDFCFKGTVFIVKETLFMVIYFTLFIKKEIYIFKSHAIFTTFIFSYLIDGRGS